MFLQIVQHTPIWVWAVLAVVLTLGLQQTRTRKVSFARATMLPAAMIILSLSSVLNAFSHVPVAFAAWMAGGLLTLAVAGRALGVRGASWSPQERRFTVPGSWIPVTLILGIFLVKYVAGVYLAMHPAMTGDTFLACALSLVYGIFAGLFWARARSLRALVRDDYGAQTA